MSPASWADAILKFLGIQRLRAFAALAVLWAHIQFSAPNLDLAWLNTNVGAIGVDIFFVISGFIIALTGEKIGRDWRLFAVHRVARVVPLYYLASAPFLVWTVFRMNPNAGSKIWNSLLFLPIWDQGEFVNPAHLFGWTLCFEMWFYAVFALAIWAVGGRRAVVFVPLALGTGVLVQTLFYRTEWVFPRFVLNPLVLEFCAGCLLCRLRARLSLKVAIGCAVLAVLMLPLVFSFPRLGWHNEVIGSNALAFQRVLVWGTFATLLMAAVVGFDQAGVFARRSAFDVLGDASYSIYLVQPVFRLLVPMIFPGGGWLAAAGFVLGSIMGGLGMWFFAERPITRTARRFGESLLAGRSRPVAASG